MTKADLKLAVNETTDLGEKSGLAVEAVIEALFNELNKPGGKVTIRGLGTFENKLSGKKKARNISTGEVILLPPTRKVTFKASRKFDK